ncbi:MAG: Orotidine 5'-phosphate decarboxylase [Verrucomicrobiae bacterium]|nr:Orotidine 5'-phosphate decarboxylase [Verrucomicrobiae bacterium]
MKSKLIVALDVDTFAEAAALVNDLSPVVEIFKVGSQLFTRVGPRMLDHIHQTGRQVFLDLKFHDIPNTVAKAVAAAAAHKVFMLTVHASGGAEMLQAAAQVTGRPMIVGVTVLTSVAGDVQAEVLSRARLCQTAGLDGVVASPQELPALRQKYGEQFVIVTPGIRPAWAATGDQKRIMTPAEAIAAGATYLVVGRPILAAADRKEAAERVLAEMGS